MMVRSLCGVVALSLLPALPAAAQSDSTPVTLDLVVRDKKDALVADLRAEEIELYENGAKRPFEGLKRVAGPATGGAAQAASAPAGAPRLAVLLFPKLQGSERELARSAAEEFLKKQLTPGMSVAVLLVGPELVPVQDFTSDPALLTAAVKKALDPAAKSGEADVRALFALVQWLKGQPDRKTVLLFSSGVSVPPGFEEVSQEIVGVANRYRVSFYGIDPRGVEVSKGGIRIEEQGGNNNSNPNEGKGISQAPAQEAWLRGQAARDEDHQASLSGNKEDLRGYGVNFGGPFNQGPQALAMLTQGTGGFVSERTNNLSKAIRQIGEDAGGYYELTYTPATAKAEGELRPLEIKVTREGAKVQARRQYLLGDAPATLVPAYEQRLTDALAADPPAHGLDVFDRALHYGWDGKEMNHVLWVAIPLDKISLTEVTAAAKFQGDISVLTRVKDSSGKIATSFSQRFPLAGPLDQMSRARTQTVPLIRRVKLAPGQYTLETAVEDKTGSKIAARHTPFKVQAPQGIALSSLSLCDALPAGQGADPDDPLIVNNQRLVPNVGQPIKAGTGSMTLHSVIYPAVGSKDPANIAITLLLQGQAINNASAVLPAPDAKGRIRYATAFKMDVLPPGDYRFDVAVTQGSTKAEESVPFTITP